MPHVETRLGRWYVEERGTKSEGPAIVCLHGLLFDHRQWRHQLGPLGEIGRTLAFDSPGHGRSAVPPPFTLEEHADALADAFDRLEVERAVVLGLSWGGMLAMRFALAHPQRVHGLALLDTSADAEPLALRIRYGLFAAFHQYIGMPYSLYEREIAPKMYGPETLRQDRSLVEATGRDLLGFDRLGVARAARAVVVTRGSVLRRLGEIRVPTLVVCGEHDRATPPEKSRDIVRAIGGKARLEMVARAGHMTPLERPDELGAVLLPFVRERVSAVPSWVST